MTSPAADAVLERITLRRVNATFGYAAVRLPGVHLTGLRVEQQPDGRLTVRAPEKADRDGRLWPIYALQPGTREAIERELAALWERSTP